MANKKINNKTIIIILIMTFAISVLSMISANAQIGAGQNVNANPAGDVFVPGINNDGYNDAGAVNNVTGNLATNIAGTGSINGTVGIGDTTNLNGTAGVGVYTASGTIAGYYNNDMTDVYNATDYNRNSVYNTNNITGDSVYENDYRSGTSVYNTSANRYTDINGTTNNTIASDRNTTAITNRNNVTTKITAMTNRYQNVAATGNVNNTDSVVKSNGFVAFTVIAIAVIILISLIIYGVMRSTRSHTVDDGRKKK